MTLGDKELITRATNGSTEALSELLRRHGPSVQQSLQIGAIWQAAIDAGDVMQVTYLEAFLQIANFDPNKADSFPAWLRRIAENNLRDAIKGLERQKQPHPRDRVVPKAFEDSLIGLNDLLGATSTTPSKVVGRAEACSLLEGAIARLPERYRQVVQLYDLEGRDVDEVAAQIGKTAGAVYMLRARAHERLRADLGTRSKILDSGA